MSESERTFTWIAGPEGRADQELARVTGVSRATIQRLMLRGLVRVDGVVVPKRFRLRPGQSVEVTIQPVRRPPAPPAEGSGFTALPILFEDEHLVVVDKPAGLVVHGDHVHTDSVSSRLLAQVGTLSVGSDVARPGIVHRLDRWTSGVLVVAKTDLAHAKLSELFSQHQIERRYWAFCYGIPRQDEGRIDSLLGRNPGDRKKMAVVTKGRRAVTRYRVVKKFRRAASLVEASLETGRTHQVRVHLTSLGCSLLGDPTYGVPTDRQPKWLALPEPVQDLVRSLAGQALHARVLGFRHPLTGQSLRFESPLPKELVELLRSLETCLAGPHASATARLEGFRS